MAFLSLRAQGLHIPLMHETNLLKGIQNRVNTPYARHQRPNPPPPCPAPVPDARDNPLTVLPARHPNPDWLDVQYAIACLPKARHQFLMPLPQILPAQGRKANDQLTLQHESGRLLRIRRAARHGYQQHQTRAHGQRADRANHGGQDKHNQV